MSRTTGIPGERFFEVIERGLEVCVRSPAGHFLFFTRFFADFLADLGATVEKVDLAFLRVCIDLVPGSFERFDGFGGDVVGLLFAVGHETIAWLDLVPLRNVRFRVGIAFGVLHRFAGGEKRIVIGGLLRQFFEGNGWLVEDGFASRRVDSFTSKGPRRRACRFLTRATLRFSV